MPSYKLDYGLNRSPAGNVVLSFKITQANVTECMLVPLYVELADGRSARLGQARLVGNSSKDAPRPAILNYYDDVLALPN